MTKNPVEDMRVFREVLDAGSFTAAADRLDTSKQLVSRRIQALEERLGVRLLNRTTRRLSPTPLGLAYLERAREILQAVDEAEDAIGQQSSRPHGRLRVSAPMSFGTLHLAPRMPAFLAAYPEVELAMDLNDRMVDLVGEGYDLAVRIGPLADSSLMARRIGTVHLLTCASPAYLTAAGTPATPADLAGHRCLIYGHGRTGTWQYAGPAGKRPATVTVSGPLCSNNGEMLREVALGGRGLIQLPDFLVDDVVATGQLIRVLDDHAPPPFPLSAVYPRHRQTSPLVRAFIDFLAASIGITAPKALSSRVLGPPGFEPGTKGL